MKVKDRFAGMTFSVLTEGQLGIGFGSCSSPDCRGITPEELQKIDFSKVDFFTFYDDLNSGSDIPADNNQMEKMKEWMKAMFDQGSSH